MEDWKSKLLEKANLLLESKVKLAESDRKTVEKVKAILDTGNTPSWRLHKEFTAVRMRVLDKLGAKKMDDKGKGLSYWREKL